MGSMQDTGIGIFLAICFAGGGGGGSQFINEKSVCTYMYILPWWIEIPNQLSEFAPS